MKSGIQHATLEKSNDRSIVIGKACVPYDEHFYRWVLPGGQTTGSESVARRVCTKMAKMMRGDL